MLTEGSVVATGVDAIRFDFNNVGTGDNLTWSGYREIDVFGTATVPEPGSLALLSLGGGMILIALRRRRR